MKYLVRFDKEDNKYIDMVTANEEYIHKYYEIEQLEEKDGYYIKTYYDEKEDKVKQRYVEMPKSEVELLEEEILKIKKAIADKEKQPDLSELDELA